jgi:hypothetical protein
LRSHCQKDAIHYPLIEIVFLSISAIISGFDGIEKKFSSIDYSQAEDNDYGHGRIESRTCYAVALPDYLKEFHNDWVDLNSLVCIVSSRESKGITQQE